MPSVMVPIKTVSVMNVREHPQARARRAKLHRVSAHYAMKQLHERPALPCVVTLTRIGAKKLDGDNLQSALKACRDGVADWLGLDDADPRVKWEYDQRTAKECGVLVEIA